MHIETPLIKIRRAVEEDVEALDAVYRESWSQAYTGIIPALYLDRMVRGRGVSWWARAIQRQDDILVVEAAGVIAGYATFGPARAGGPRNRGEIYEIYLKPVYQGIGLGERLFEACRTALDNRSYSGLVVWALGDNTNAADFYWRRGGRPAGRSMEPFGSTKLPKIAFAFG